MHFRAQQTDCIPIIFMMSQTKPLQFGKFLSWQRLLLLHVTPCSSNNKRFWVDWEKRSNVKGGTEKNQKNQEILKQIRNYSWAKHSNNPKVLYYCESIQCCYKISRILPCIYFSTVIFIIPTISTFSEDEVTTQNFLVSVPSTKASSSLGPGSGIRIFFKGLEEWGSGPALKPHISNALWASQDAGQVTGMWIGAPVPSLPPSAPPSLSP